MKQYLFSSLDDLQDIVDLCQETATLFPELAASHDEVGLFELESDAHALAYQIGQVYRDKAEVSTEVDRMGPLWVVRVMYTLSDDEFEECVEAMEDYAKEMEPMSYDNPADRQLIDTARKMIKDGMVDRILNEIRDLNLGEEKADDNI